MQHNRDNRPRLAILTALVALAIAALFTVLCGSVKAQETRLQGATCGPTAFSQPTVEGTAWTDALARKLDGTDTGHSFTRVLVGMDITCEGKALNVACLTLGAWDELPADVRLLFEATVKALAEMTFTPGTDNAGRQGTSHIETFAVYCRGGRVTVTD